MTVEQAALVGGEPFITGSGAHQSAVLAMLALTLGWCWMARFRPQAPSVRAVEVTLGWALWLVWPLSLWIGWHYDLATWDNALPLHLCDVTAFVAGAALLCRSAQAAELTWFWGLAGTANGLITPTLELNFPHPEFWRFFLLHGGIVATAIYLIWGRRRFPREGAVGRTMGASFVYLFTVSGLNWILQTNYGFLCGPPPTASLFDHLGAWPLYLISLPLLALGLFGVLNLPFIIQRRLSVQAPRK
jgi:hypothetical integral membrane protein (TIGR02206 family)